jgi:hypothetical protein
MILGVEAIRAQDHRFEWTQTDLDQFVREIWQIDLLPWQLADLFKFVHGGIFSYSIPTDHGKSMLLEMAAAARLTADPNRRAILVKINDTAAREVVSELARRMYQIAQLRSHGGPAYPGTKPMLKWGRDREGIDPWGIGLGFDLEGRDYAERNINKSVKGYALGSRDIQGKRGDTFIDDVERQEEARSEAYREQLKVRIDAVLRTIEARMDTIWMIVGTPFHADSVYSYITRSLQGINRPYEQIHRPFKNPDGTYLWPERAEKVELHRKTMSKSAFAAAYELTPIRTRRLTAEEIQRALRDPHMPWFRNEREVWDYLMERWRSHCPPWKTMTEWMFEGEQRLQQGLMFYVSWDPATVGDWAIVALACWGDETFVLRCKVATGDTWEQVLTVRDFFLAFPSAYIIWESNGQQKAFADLIRQDDVLSQANIIGHGTGRQIRDPHSEVGLPAMVDSIHQGYFKTPWMDEDRAQAEFVDLEEELSHYSETSHPHALPAIWFAWRWHKLHALNTSIRRTIARKEVERRTEMVKILTPRAPAPTLGQQHTDQLRTRTRGAWKRRA